MAILTFMSIEGSLRIWTDQRESPFKASICVLQVPPCSRIRC